MKRQGPIVMIDDDEDDLELMQMAVADLDVANEIKMFSSTREALEYIQRPEVLPFLILSDINMPMQNGFSLKATIKTNRELDVKCIPFLFITTGATEEVVNQAYSLKVQGIFQKPRSLSKWREMLRDIINYWTECLAPGRFQANF